MWKNVVQPGRPQMTIWRMRIASCIPKSTNTNSEFVILIASPLQQWSHERASMLRYTYTACIVTCMNRWIQKTPQNKGTVLRNSAPDYSLTVDLANMKHSSASVSALGRCQVRASACYNTEIFNPQTKGDDMEMLFLCFFHLLALRDSGMWLKTTTCHVQLLRGLHHMHNEICLNNRKGCPK